MDDAFYWRQLAFIFIHDITKTLRKGGCYPVIITMVTICEKNIGYRGNDQQMGIW